MSMTYDECMAIMKQYRARFPLTMQQPGVHGMRVGLATPDANEITLQILALDDGCAQLPKEFDYSFGDAKSTVPMQVRVADYSQFESLTERCKVRGGDSMRHKQGSVTGTAGWNVYFRQQDKVVAVGNWHILCPQGNETPIGSDVYLGGQRRADLHAYKKVYGGGYINTWDYALAAYQDPSDACTSMRYCTEHGYPQRLTPRSKVRIGDMHYKVGFGSKCTEGKLLNVSWDVVADFHGLGKFLFDGQLQFERMTEKGDSGSVVVRKDGNTVTGLHIAGGDGHSTSNPFFEIGWQYRGSILLSADGPQLPMFDADMIPASNEELECSARSTFFFDTPPVADDRLDVNEKALDQVSSTWLYSDDDWPQFGGGLFDKSEDKVVSSYPELPLLESRVLAGYTNIGSEFAHVIKLSTSPWLTTENSLRVLTLSGRVVPG